MKEKEKRDVKITCRITRTVEAMINSYEGESLGDKICSMTKVAQRLNTYGMLEDRLKLMREIENLNETMQLVNKLCDNLNEMNSRYRHELLEKDRKLIRINVAEAGFVADENIIKRMLRLNELNGQENTVKDVYKMYTSKDYANDEIRDCVEGLAEAFKAQEIKAQQAANENMGIEG